MLSAIISNAELLMSSDTFANFLAAAFAFWAFVVTKSKIVVAIFFTLPFNT
jgi:hypothetical protein